MVTHRVTGVAVGDGPTQDSPQFAPAIRQAAMNPMVPIARAGAAPAARAAAVEMVAKQVIAAAI